MDTGASEIDKRERPANSPDPGVVNFAARSGLVPRGSIVALDKAFGNNLDRLDHYQSRPAEGQRRPETATRADSPPAVPPIEPVRMNVPS